VENSGENFLPAYPNGYTEKIFPDALNKNPPPANHISVIFASIIVHRSFVPEGP
jgi:hypothetical protein